MKGIQFILLAGVALISILVVARFKKKITYLLLLSLITAVSVVFIIWPDVTSKIANWLGVGRGADLVFYISILIFWLAIVYLFGKVRRLEAIVALMIRNEALNKTTRISTNEPAPD